MEDVSNPKSQINLKAVTFITMLVILLLWTSTIIFSSSDNETRGTFGDMFGAVNALFSGLAFGGIIITILLQREELSLQRDELKETRRELERTARAQEQSRDELERQANNLKQSAKLTALNTLVSYYSQEEERIKFTTMADPKLYFEANEKKIGYLKMIEDILQNKMEG